MTEHQRSSSELPAELDVLTPWPTAELLRTPRLDLEPLRLDHSDEAFAVLDDPRLHRFTGDAPDTREQLAARFARQVLGRSPDGRQGWLNWMMRHRDTGEVVGTVQATLIREVTCRAGNAADSTSGHTAELAWVVGHDHQGRGYATEAASDVAAWLTAQGVDGLTAHVRPDHDASVGVARRLNLHPTDHVVDGEVLWTTGRDDVPENWNR